MWSAEILYGEVLYQDILPSAYSSNNLISISKLGSYHNLASYGLSNVLSLYHAVQHMQQARQETRRPDRHSPARKLQPIASLIVMVWWEQKGQTINGFTSAPILWSVETRRTHLLIGKYELMIMVVVSGIKIYIKGLVFFSNW